MKTLILAPRFAPFLTLLVATLPASVRASGFQEIPVILFEQHCMLRGPFDQATLKQVHSISPEQVDKVLPPPYSSEPTRKMLELLKEATSLPAGLDRYRERLTRRLEAQLAFLDAVETSRNNGNPDAVTAASRKYLQGTRLNELVATAKKTRWKEKSIAPLDRMFRLFSDGIEPDPEEEFHRGISQLNIEYRCNFDDGEEGGE